MSEIPVMETGFGKRNWVVGKGMREELIFSNTFDTFSVLYHTHMTPTQ